MVTSRMWRMSRNVDEEDKNTLANREGNKGNPNQTAVEFFCDYFGGDEA